MKAAAATAAAAYNERIESTQEHLSLLTLPSPQYPVRDRTLESEWEQQYKGCDRKYDGKLFFLLTVLVQVQQVGPSPAVWIGRFRVTISR
ncbi:GL14065 [Drosophila persimilis]|uniref:GL14065 n=1 Tax=Drosophila persimilis TaxID=7234 RepID=B4GQP5_DROPE|nr:GL14065 [Drosophila persimilis]